MGKLLGNYDHVAATALARFSTHSQHLMYVDSIATCDEEPCRRVGGEGGFRP